MEKFHFKSCPIEKALEFLGKKWAINIIRDLFLGKKRFSEFLEANKGLSAKVLSERLRDFENEKLIVKTQISSQVVEYSLTEKGLSVNKILYEMAAFSLKNCSDELYDREFNFINEDLKNVRKVFGVE